MIFKHNQELFKLFHNLINYERAYFEQYIFPYGQDMNNQIKELKSKIYKSVLVNVELCPYVTYSSGSGWKKALFKIWKTILVWIYAGRTHGQLSKEQGNHILLHSLCLWIPMFGYASPLVRGWISTNAAYGSLQGIFL